jgi:demethylmenaquinone methyltransferase / 2-methoxy-6-polyprenyl-1,4-benzoquinol methylase
MTARRSSAGSEDDAATLPTGAAKRAAVKDMFDAIAPRYDLVNRLMTGGLDQRWRRRTLDALGLPAGSRIVDLGSGTGDFVRLARRAGHQVMGVDLSWEMLAAGRARGALVAVQADAELLPIADASLDGLVSGFALRNLRDLGASLGEAARVLRPGGRLALLEVAQPPPGPLRFGFGLWFDHVVPVIGGLLSDRAAYRYLPKSVAYLPDEAGLRALLQDSGFATVGRRLLNGGLSQLITATRTGLPAGATTGRPR